MGLIKKRRKIGNVHNLKKYRKKWENLLKTELIN